MDPLKSVCEITVKDEPGAVIFSDRKQVSYPKDVVTDGGVPQLEVPEAITCGSVFPVIVRNVNSPSKFWINLVGLWFSERLHALYGEMETFYDAQHENYYLPSSAITPGQFCVCLYARKWLRAKIMEVVHTNLVGVFFIDYGGTVFVTNDTLRFMHNRFTVVPMQSFRAYIPGLKAKNAGEWQNDVCEYFRKELSGKKVRARVVRLFRRTYTFEVALLDDINRNIADLMIVYGLAEADLSGTFQINVKSLTEQHEQDSPTVSVKKVAHISDTRTTAQRSQVKETFTQEPPCNGNRIDQRSDISYGHVAFEDKSLLVVTINEQQYFVFPEFVYTLTGMHEHVALEVMATRADTLPLWKLLPYEVKMFMNSVEGQNVPGLKRFRHGAGMPNVHLMPLFCATEVLNLFDVDEKYKTAVSNFVSYMLQPTQKGPSLSSSVVRASSVLSSDAWCYSKIF